MKISLAWMFDHINGNWYDIEVHQLVDIFNKTTAEISDFKKVSINPDSFVIGKVKSCDKENVILEAPHIQKEWQLSLRLDASCGEHFLLVASNNSCRWATMADIGSEKDGLFPALDGRTIESDTGCLEYEDWILEIDNKSITNRPDLWGHRGMARECAALLGMSLKPIDSLIVPKVIKEHEGLKVVEPSSDFPCTISIDDEQTVKKYANLYCDYIEPSASSLWMALRLARIDVRPINMIIDSTNYVMADIGQPLHAFDFSKLETRSLILRMARSKETIELLDGQTIELTEHDYVISDGKRPIALAGIMGGKSTAISKDTQSIILESACFDAGTIRKTAAFHHIRTESSARYEKSLDPNQSIIGILRFLKLLENLNVHFRVSERIISLGYHVQETRIIVEHKFIEKRLGVTIDENFVVQTLEKLEFCVCKDSYAHEITYIITVPTFRASKDITRKEDIVEEIGRFFGYGSIPCVLPERIMKPFDIHIPTTVRAIKQFMAYSLGMHEVCNYALFDETFLHELSWDTSDAITIKNPVSEHMRRLVTTLVPGLLKNLVVNRTAADQLRFFEWGRIWKKGLTLLEQRVLTGIMFDQKNSIDFYQSKERLSRFFDFLQMKIVFSKIDKPDYPWSLPFQSAFIECQGHVIGYAGIVDPGLLKKITDGGSAFVFELDADFIQSYKPAIEQFVPIPKFPVVERDISILVPGLLTVDELVACIKNTSSIIVDVKLIDFFTKPEWADKRSLTFRCKLLYPEKTMTAQEVNDIMGQVEKILLSMGAQIR